jgi:hypothetical protein
LRAHFRESAKQYIKFNVQKVPLKIEKAGDFKSIIPTEGYVRGRQIYEHGKQEDIIVSTEGVIVRRNTGLWEFRGLHDYEESLKKI